MRDNFANVFLFLNQNIPFFVWFPKTTHSLLSKSIDSLFKDVNSPTLIPVDERSSIITLSLSDEQESFKFSIFSSVYACLLKLDGDLLNNI